MLERGQVKGVIKLAFNPVQAARDFLYKNGLNGLVRINLSNCWELLRAS